MTTVGTTIHKSSPVYDIDYWKRYRSVNGGEFTACTEELYDYLCPSSQVDNQQVYVFNAPATLEEDLNVNDEVQYQWRPAYLDEDIEDAEDFYIESDVYTVTESSSNLTLRIQFIYKRRRRK